MDWGMKNRLARIIRPATGRTVMLAVDHGYFLGPTTGLEDMRKNIMPLAPYADSLMINRGALRASIAPTIDTPVVLRVSGGTSILSELSDEVIAVNMEEAIRLNAAAVAVSIFVGSKNEKQTLDNLCRLVNEGERYGIPVLAVTAVGKDMVRDVRYLSLASRIAAELGARFVKTYYCDEFQKLTANVPVPVVIAGGKKLEEKDALELTYDAISHGAVGVDMGRNIFQSAAPVAMIQAVRSIVHENYSAGKAFKLFNTLKAGKAKSRK
jgi:putative autoinducer-2 (AI-2) aldolase